MPLLRSSLSRCRRVLRFLPVAALPASLEQLHFLVGAIRKDGVRGFFRRAWIATHCSTCGIKRWTVEDPGQMFFGRWYCGEPCINASPTMANIPSWFAEALGSKK